MKHLTVISISVCCMLFSMLSIATEKAAADAVLVEDTEASTETVNQTITAAEETTETQTEQALKSVPLKPATNAKVELGTIDPVDSSAAIDAIEAQADEVAKQPETFTPITPVAAVDINPEDAAPISLDEVNADSAIPTDRIRSVISSQEKAWNSGDIDAYMQGYWNSDKLRFVSNGKYNYGWDSILASYKRSYPTSERMGKLSFNVREIKMLSNYAALVVGRWTLERAKDKPSGVFTLLIERIDDKWVITHDHSSD